MRNRLVALVFLSSATIASADLVSDYASSVTQASYSNFVDQALFTHYGNSRKFPSGSSRLAARDGILNHFASVGLQSSLESFSYQGQTGWNIVGVLPGRVTPQNVYLVGAHWDSTNLSGAGSGTTAGAPGADDNASGTAGVMEAARALAGHPFESTIAFVAFDAEEVGLIGSKAYVTRHIGTTHKAAIAMDMIAYNPTANHDRAHIYYKIAGTGLPLANALSTAFTQFSGLTASGGVQGVAEQYTTYDMTDHAPFANAGAPAVAVLESNVWNNPNYHTWMDSIDTPGYMDLAYASKITRGVTGYLAGAAGALQLGDADLDDDVDFNDLLLLAQRYGTTSAATWTQGDFNADGAVDFGDLLLLAQAYGTGTINLSATSFEGDWALAQSIAPEPLELCVVLAGALAIRRRR